MNDQIPLIYSVILNSLSLPTYLPPSLSASLPPYTSPFPSAPSLEVYNSLNKQQKTSHAVCVKITQHLLREYKGGGGGGG